MLLLSLVPALLASPSDLAACCDAVGAASGTCPASVATVDGRSAISGVLVTGVNVLVCGESPRFDPAGRRIAGTTPHVGEILTPISVEALACFQRSCALPADTCLTTDASGRNLAGACTATPVVAAPVGVAPALVSDRASPAPVATPVSLAKAPASVTVSFDMPDAPTEACAPNAALVRPSNDQVDLGDDARIASDLQSALTHYRAAIVINACNAYAWASLGEALWDAGRLPDARLALATSTKLMPTHHVAWARLGAIEESTGAADRAGAAYSAALAANPSYQPARDALTRLGP
jgi:tetratricopeptide (TPR) repeat protein